MSTPLPPETLAWLHQAAAAGVAEPMVLRHLMRRLEALESDWAQELRASHAYNEAVVEETVRRLEKLEAAQQQPANHAPAATKMVATSEGAPVSTHAELLAIRSWLSHRPVLDGDLEEPGRQHGAAQPAPPPAPFKKLVKRVAIAMHPNFPGAFKGEARAAIHETLLTVAAWLDLEGYVRAANDLREEVVE